MNTYKGIIKSVDLAFGTPYQHKGLVLDVGKYIPLEIYYDNGKKFIDQEVKLVGYRVGFNLHVTMITSKSGESWSL